MRPDDPGSSTVALKARVFRMADCHAVLRSFIPISGPPGCNRSDWDESVVLKLDVICRLSAAPDLLCPFAKASARVRRLATMPNAAAYVAAWASRPSPVRPRPLQACGLPMDETRVAERISGDGRLSRRPHRRAEPRPVSGDGAICEPGFFRPPEDLVRSDSSGAVHCPISAV